MKSQAGCNRGTAEQGLISLSPRHMAKAASARLSHLKHEPRMEDVPAGFYRAKFHDHDVLLPKEARCWDRRDIAKYIRKVSKDLIGAEAVPNPCLSRQPAQAGSLLPAPQANTIHQHEHDSLTLVVRLDSHAQCQVPDAVLEVVLAAAVSVIPCQCMTS